MSTYHHLPPPIPKYQYIIAADPGASIGVFLKTQMVADPKGSYFLKHKVYLKE